MYIIVGNFLQASEKDIIQELTILLNLIVELAPRIVLLFRKEYLDAWKLSVCSLHPEWLVQEDGLEFPADFHQSFYKCKSVQV